MKSPSKQARLEENEAELVRRISSDDKFAFEILFRRYYAELVRFSFHMTGSIEASKDIVQDVFIKVWEGRKNLDPERSIKIYLYRAVRNQTLNYLNLKHLKFESFAEITDDFEIGTNESNPEMDLYYSELEKIVQKAIQHMPERCRLIFLLHRQNGLTYSEIAQILEISIKTVETQMGRALKILRKVLTPYLHLFIFLL